VVRPRVGVGDEVVIGPHGGRFFAAGYVYYPAGTRGVVTQLSPMSRKDVSSGWSVRIKPHPGQAKDYELWVHWLDVFPWRDSTLTFATFTE
jgi:hypothetical protein